MGIQIHELATKSGNLSSSDFLVVDNGGVTAKIDYTKLAKAIVEQYNGSTIAGSAQTLQSALNGLNTNKVSFKATVRTGGDLLDESLTEGFYYIQGASANFPNDSVNHSGYLTVKTKKGGESVFRIHEYQPYNEGTVYVNMLQNSQTWTGWKALPSIDEMKASWANYGCKNLLSQKNAPATNTVNGVTFTMNGDGSVKVSGTATADAFFWLISSGAKALGLASGRYTLSGGSSNVTVQVQYNGTWLSDTGNAPSFTYNSASTASDLARLFVKNGKTVNETIYPMIRSASIADDTYVPYAPNNAELNTSAYQMKGSLPTGTDLNDITTTGTYFISGSYSYTHSPAGYGILIVMRYQTEGSICSQMIVNGAQLWTRYYGGSSWSTWYRATMTAQGS